MRQDTEGSSDMDEHRLEAMWHDSTIARELHRQLEERPSVIECYYANPCPETLAPLQEMQEHQRQEVARAEQLRDNLKQMVSSLKATTEGRRQSAAAARALGDRETAESRTREQASFEASLLSVQQTLEQAEETLVDAYALRARQEAFLAREADRLAGKVEDLT